MQAQNRQPLPNSRPHKTLPRLLMQGRKPFMYVSKLYKGSRYVPLHSNPTARTASSCKRFLSPPCFCTKGSRLKEHLDKTKLQPHTFKLKQLSPWHTRTPYPNSIFLNLCQLSCELTFHITPMQRQLSMQLLTRHNLTKKQ